MRSPPLEEKTPVSTKPSGNSIPATPTQKDAFLFGHALSAEDQAYVRELTTYSIARLQKEPTEITKESERIGTEIESLAVRNYRSFIETSQALSHAHSAITKMDSSLKELVTHIPKFVQSVDSFSKDSKAVKEAQRLNRIIAEHEAELGELMALPELMETCVRSGLYEEALDVEAYASSLALRCPDITILQDLVRDMESTVRTLFAQLLDKLRSPIQLSTCLRVVSYLRRLNILSESDLRAEFLRSRTAWLTGVLDSAGTEDTGAEYLSKYIDSCRVHLREVIIQYRAIFVDDNSTAEEDEDRGLLCFWVNARILILVSTIKRVLGGISDGAMIANILEQSMYCGLSLARVGSDFRSLLPAIFEERIYQIFCSTLEASKEQFLSSFEEYEWHMSAEDLGRLGIPTTGGHGEKDVCTFVKLRKKRECVCEDIVGKLVEYPSLSILANAFVDAINMLRHCALISLSARTTKKAEQMLLWATTHLQNLQLSWQEAIPRGSLLDLARAFSIHLVPFVSKLFKDVFNQKQDVLDTTLVLSPLQGLFAEEKAAEQKFIEEQRQAAEEAAQAKLAADRHTESHVLSQKQALAELAEHSATSQAENSAAQEPSMPGHSAKRESEGTGSVNASEMAPEATGVPHPSLAISVEEAENSPDREQHDPIEPLAPTPTHSADLGP